MLRTASSRPASKGSGLPLLAPSRYRASGITRSSSVTGRRYARHAERKGRQDFLTPVSLRTRLPKLRRAQRVSPDPRTVEALIELLRFRSQPDNAAASSALVQPQLKQILAIDGKVVAKRQSAAR